MTLGNVIVEAIDGEGTMKVGDNVILTGSYWKGCEGVLTEISKKGFVRTTFLNGRKFPIKQVRILDPNEKNPREKYY